MLGWYEFPYNKAYIDDELGMGSVEERRQGVAYLLKGRDKGGGEGRDSSWEDYVEAENMEKDF